jgi:hypothetical protein
VTEKEEDKIFIPNYKNISNPIIFGNLPNPSPGG